MTGSLRVKHKTYYMLFSWKDESGQWRQKSESTGIPERGGKRKAQELLNARLEELQMQSTASLTIKDMPFLDFLKDWLNDRMASELRPNTFTQYRKVVENNICQYKPFVGVKLKKLTPDQLLELLDVFHDDPIESVVRLAVTYGMRRSEICGLLWDAVDFDAGTIYICHTAVKNQGEILFADRTKTATSRRHLPLTASMRDYLLEVKAEQERNRTLFGRAYMDSGCVCCKADGTPIDPDFVTHHFRRVVQAHGLTCRFHDLRHSAVNTLRKGDCDVKDIQAWLGHSDVSTTLNVYRHLMDGDMSRMGAVMDKMLFEDGAAG